MLITKTSILSGKTRTLDIDITPEAYAAWKASRQVVQKAFPHLNDSDREFLVSGITSEEWDSAFSDEEE
jgi:hypothetical protein